MRIQVQILFPILLHLDPNSSGGEGGGTQNLVKF